MTTSTASWPNSTSRGINFFLTALRFAGGLDPKIKTQRKGFFGDQIFIAGDVVK